VPSEHFTRKKRRTSLSGPPWHVLTKKLCLVHRPQLLFEGIIKEGLSAVAAYLAPTANTDQRRIMSVRISRQTASPLMSLLQARCRGDSSGFKEEPLSKVPVGHICSFSDYTLSFGGWNVELERAIIRQCTCSVMEISVKKGLLD